MFSITKYWAWGGVLFALKPLSTIKDGYCPFNFQSNELFFKFLLQQMAILKYLSDAFRKNSRCGGNTSNEPFPKFIGSPFLYIPYIHTLYGGGISSHPKSHYFLDLSIALNKIAFSKFY